MADFPSDPVPLGLVHNEPHAERDEDPPDIWERLTALIDERKCDGTIKLWGYSGEHATEPKPVPRNWRLEWFAGPDREHAGYYCDVGASPRPRQGVNEKLSSGLVRLIREWANMRDGVRYEAPAASTLGTELYHRSLHEVLREVQISEAVLNQLIAEVGGSRPETPSHPQPDEPAARLAPDGEALTPADIWMRANFQKGDKREPAIKDCMHATGAKWREAEDAYRNLPAELKRRRGGRDRSFK